LHDLAAGPLPLVASVQMKLFEKNDMRREIFAEPCQTKTKRLDNPAHVAEIEALTENEMILLGWMERETSGHALAFPRPAELLREH
jgi:hypothetical protein